MAVSVFRRAAGIFTRFSRTLGDDNVIHIRVISTRNGGFYLIKYHYTDVIMGAIASRIISLTIVYSTVYSDADQRKHQSSASLTFVRGIFVPGEFPAQMARIAEKFSIWWRHHASVWSWVGGGWRVLSHIFLKLPVIETNLTEQNLTVSFISIYYSYHIKHKYYVFFNQKKVNDIFSPYLSGML